MRRKPCSMERAFDRHGRALTRTERIEQSILRKFRKEIWRKFTRGVREYEMIADGDRIAVCISGGKDSMLLAKCMQELQRHGEKKFELVFLCMDPGYHAENRRKIEENAQTLGLNLQIFETEIFDTVAGVEQSPCYLCARMRRGFLYANAQKHGCNKIALGHHFDDVVETILMSMMYAADYRTMMPKLRSTNFAGMELIRPLYLVPESAIKAWARYNGLEFIRCACRFTERGAEDVEQAGKRAEIKRLLETLRKTNPNVDLNIFRSVHAVNLDTIIGWKQGGKYVSFLDTYGNPKEKNE